MAKGPGTTRWYKGGAEAHCALRTVQSPSKEDAQAWSPGYHRLVPAGFHLRDNPAGVGHRSAPQQHVPPAAHPQAVCRGPPAVRHCRGCDGTGCAPWDNPATGSRGPAAAVGTIGAGRGLVTSTLRAGTAAAGGGEGSGHWRARLRRGASCQQSCTGL